MQRRFAILRGEIRVRSALEQKLAKPPMAVEGGAAQIEVFAERGEPLALLQKELDGADVAVVRAPLDQRHAISVHGFRGMPGGDVLKHQVRAPVGDFSQGVVSHEISLSSPALIVKPPASESYRYSACRHRA